MDFSMTYQNVMFKVESPFLINIIKFRVQFVCNWSGNYGLDGHCGRFFRLFVDYIDTKDTIIRYGQAC